MGLFEINYFAFLHGLFVSMSVNSNQIGDTYNNLK